MVTDSEVSLPRQLQLSCLVSPEQSHHAPSGGGSKPLGFLPAKAGEKVSAHADRSDCKVLGLQRIGVSVNIFA